MSKYLFNWDLISLITEGTSALDHKHLFGSIYSLEKINDFIKGYGVDINDPVGEAELFGSFQEAMQFVNKYFLKENNPQGLDLKIPPHLFTVVHIKDLLTMTSRKSAFDIYDKMWGEVILKVMHTIIHVDKDLRSNYFSIIQTQVFDRFYKHIHRENDEKLYLGSEGQKIELEDFEAKAKKTRDSVIIKLLHKEENVAEDLFDRIGVRFITKTRFDVLRIIGFLLDKSIVTPHNIKPSRSINSLIDIEGFKRRYHKTLKSNMRNKTSEGDFLQELEGEMKECIPAKKTDFRNQHTSSNYRSIQFTSRQLIKYKNPFLQEFQSVRQMAKEIDENDKLAKMILSLDNSLIARNIQFFYPYEVQILDMETHKENTKGEASHQDYKRGQIKSVIKRIFKDIIEYKKIDFQ